MANYKRATLFAIIAFLMAIGPSSCEQLESGEPKQQLADTECPYLSPRFSALIEESYRYCGSKNPASSFYNWMDKAYRKPKYRIFSSKQTLESFLQERNQQLNSITDPATRTRAELDLSVWAHRTIRSTIPGYNLDKGFEFYNAAARRERQCFLQSTTVSGLLQAAGVNCGVVMVCRNTQGEPTNNGHAVVMVRLSNGKDIIVDGSHRDTFVRQRGLMVRAPGYRYVTPVYDGRTGMIQYYRPIQGGGTIQPSKVNTLSYDFMRSQFWYYRGERAVGGPLAKRPSRSGLQTARKALETSVSIDPRNPLSTYMLGRVYLQQGSTTNARKTLSDAYRLYAAYGWVPESPRQYLNKANRTASK